MRAVVLAFVATVSACGSEEPSSGGADSHVDAVTDTASSDVRPDDDARDVQRCIGDAATESCSDGVCLPDPHCSLDPKCACPAGCWGFCVADAGDGGTE